MYICMVWIGRWVRLLHASMLCAPARVCAHVCALQPLFLKDNFFQTPLLLERGGIEPVVK